MRIENPASPIPAKLQGLHLFHFDGAPCAQRVRFALGEKGLHRGREVKFDDVTASACQGESGKWVSRQVSLVAKDHMTETYAAIHPNMVVPALVHDGSLFLESMDIILYIDETFDGPRLVPTEELLRQATMARVEEAKVLHRSIRFVTFHWGLGRLAMLNKKEREKLMQLATQGSDDEMLVDFYEQYSTGTVPESTYVNHLLTLFSAFNQIESALMDGRQFLMSDDVTIADAFWAMKVLRLIECGYPFADHHPQVLNWFNRVSQRPSFQNEVMGKNKLGHHGFRIKAGLENLIGIGLRSAVEQHCLRQAA